MPSEKLDLYKLHKADYVAKQTPVIVDTSDANYLVIDGGGEPGGAAFQVGIAVSFRNEDFAILHQDKRQPRDGKLLHTLSEERIKERLQGLRSVCYRGRVLPGR